MKVKRIAAARVEVVAVMDGDDCPVERFIQEGESDTEAARSGLFEMLKLIAERGLDNVPYAWSHEADKKLGIFEFVKGPLRLFYFKGANGQVAVCTGGVRKSGRKADPPSVKKAARWRQRYFESLERGDLITVNDYES